MDTSSYDVTQIWIGEEATNQTGEFLQSTHGSNGFTSEVPFGLVDTGATDAVGFDVLPYPLVGVEFGRVSRNWNRHSCPWVDATKSLTALDRWTGWPSTMRNTEPLVSCISRLQKLMKVADSNLPA